MISVTLIAGSSGELAVVASTWRKDAMRREGGLCDTGLLNDDDAVLLYFM